MTVHRPPTYYTVPTGVGNREEAKNSEEELERRRSQFAETLKDVSGVDTRVQDGQQFTVPRPTAQLQHVDTLRRTAVDLNRQAQNLRINQELETLASEQEADDIDPVVVRNFNLTKIVNRYGKFSSTLPVGASLEEQNQEMYDFLLAQTPEDVQQNMTMRFQDIAFLAAGVFPPTAIPTVAGTAVGVVTQAVVGSIVDGEEDGYKEAYAEVEAMGFAEGGAFSGIWKNAYAAEEASGAGQVAGITADIAAGGPLAFGRHTAGALAIGGKGVRNLSKLQDVPAAARKTPDVIRSARKGFKYAPEISRVKKGLNARWYQDTAAKMIKPLSHSDDLLSSMFQEDKARKLALALENSSMPWAAGMLKTIAGRAALASMPVEKRGIVYAMHLIEADQKSDLALSFALSLGKNTEAVFGKTDDLGRVKIKNKWIGVGDLLEQATPGSKGSADWLNMTDLQRDWTRRMRAIEDRIVEIAKAEGIEINELAVEDGLDFATRQWMGILDSNGEFIDLRGVGRSNVRGSSGKGTLVHQRPRHFETQEEGFKAGFVAVPQEQVLRMKVHSLYKKIAERRFQGGVLSEVAWRSTAADEGLRAVALSQDKIVKGLQKGRAVIQEAMRGGTPSGAARGQVRRAAVEAQDLAGSLSNLGEKEAAAQLRALSELADEFPDLAQHMDEALALTPDEVLTVVRKMSKEMQDLTRISPDQFRDALLMVRRSKAGRRFSPSTSGRVGTMSDSDVVGRIAPGAATPEQAAQSRQVLDSDPLFPNRESRPLTSGITEEGPVTSRGDKTGGPVGREGTPKKPERLDPQKLREMGVEGDLRGLANKRRGASGGVTEGASTTRVRNTTRRTPVYTDPSSPYDYGERSVTPGELKAVLRRLNKDNKLTNTLLAKIYANAWDISNSERKDALRAVLKRIDNLEPIAKEARNITKKNLAESRKWNRHAHITKDADGNIKAFEHTLSNDPSKVVAFDTIQERDRFVRAYEDAIKLADPNPPGGIAKRVSDASSVVRLFQLGADASSMFIHLIMLLGNDPKTWAKSGKAYVQGFTDSNYRNKLLAENAELLNRNPQVLLSTSGIEFTEALNRGGFIARQRNIAVRASGRALAPFQQGVEASLDVAGIQMLKSLEHLATSPQERAQLAAYINEIRGLSNSSSLGLTSGQRMAENIVFLAPRYNRAIGALVFDAIRGATSTLRHPTSLKSVVTGAPSGSIALRQELARNAMIRGIGALSGIGIAFSIMQMAAEDRPLDWDEVLSHLNPADPAFFTWQIAGQNVGPGSKIRSLAVMLARSASNPSSLTEGGFSMNELMKNPAFRFLRSNFGPAISKPIDIITGRNFIGEPTRDNALNFGTNVVAEGLLPLSLQSLLLEGGSWSSGEEWRNRALRAGTDFFGMRSYPTPALQKFHYEAERRVEPKPEWFATDQAYKKAHDRWREGGVEWDDMPPGMKEAARQQFSDLWEEAQNERAARGLVEEALVQWDEIKDREQEKLGAIDQAYSRGEVPLSRIRTAWTEYGQAIAEGWKNLSQSERYRNTFERLAENSGESTPEAILYQRYLQIVHDPSLDNEITGRYDFERREANLRKFWEEIGPTARAAVEELNEARLSTLPPAFRRYALEHRETLRDYFGIAERRFRNQPHLWALIRRYRNATRDRQSFMRDTIPLLDYALKRIDEEERRMRISRPSLDRLLVSYYPDTYTPIAR